ncbi:MAG: hypothetical protein IPH93_17590 [Saprospiraceae bacterium]|nr:hypothetical protein [Saprospiraceae bacterium]MBK7809749.1 hypothetical protein [Saprospiraceae bacterium]MBK9632141.1 hypothetical protein [Saprospiraceae bacterium]
MISGRNIRILFQLLMALVYTTLGVMMFYAKIFDLAPWNQILAALFIVYGLWRGYRAFQHEEAESDE